MVQIFKYRFLIFIKDRPLIFWTLAFPMILTTLFFFAFGNLDEVGEFEVIDVAVVEDGNTSFESFITALSESGDNQIIDPKYVDPKEADKLLKDGDVEAIIVTSETPEIKFDKKSMQVQILSEIVQTYISKASNINNIAMENNISSQDIEYIITDKVEIANVKSNGVDADLSSQYFFSAVAMMIVYGSFFGVISIKSLQANQSDVGIRHNNSPVHKFKMIIIDFVVAFTILMLEFSVLLGYLTLILKIDFGNNMGLVWLLSISGIIMSLSLGILVGCISKLNESTNINILSAIGLFSCFLAGMMMSSLPYIINSKLPIIKYINPASLITNGYNMLYYFEDISKVYINIIILLVMALLLLLASYNILRRKTYASL